MWRVWKPTPKFLDGKPEGPMHEDCSARGHNIRFGVTWAVSEAERLARGI